MLYSLQKWDTDIYNMLATGVLCHVRYGSIITGTDCISLGNMQRYRIGEEPNFSRMGEKKSWNMSIFRPGA